MNRTIVVAFLTLGVLLAGSAQILAAPPAKAAATLLTLADSVVVPPGGLELDAVDVSTYQWVSVLGAIDAPNNVPLMLTFGDAAIPNARLTNGSFSLDSSVGVWTGQDSLTLRVGGPFLIVRILNNSGSNRIVTIKVYLQP